MTRPESDDLPTERPLRSRPRPWHLGLTGGIGSGKSTVARYLRSQGCRIIDTDALARSLTAPQGLALPAIGEAFGPAYLNPQEGLDRARMRELVFQQPDAKRQLEAILHPLIHAQAWLEAERGPLPACCVFDIPLLVEGGANSLWRPRLDWIVVVDCPEPLQLSRVQARSGWPAATVQKVIDQQATREQRKAWADTLLDNSQDLAHLQRQLEQWWPAWLQAHPA